MNETQITIRGWVGTEPQCKEVRPGMHVAEFRLATTPRKYNADTREWYDGDTMWVTVKAWRTLAENVAESVRAKQPVIVQGRLEAEVWERDGKAQTSYAIVATSIGHDLSMGRAMFQRPQRPAGAEDGSPVAAQTAQVDPTAAVEDPAAWQVRQEPAA